MTETNDTQPTFADWQAFAKVRADAIASLDAEFGTLGKSTFDAAFAAGQKGPR